MAEDQIRYDILTQDALRGVVRKVLSEVVKTGLPGEHYFYISFLTRAPGVRMSERLLEQYDKEMTIVLQNQFWDLKVSETDFQVGLSFDGKTELLHVPFTAIKSFFDPSVQFALTFEIGDTETAAENGEDETGADGDNDADTDTENGEKTVGDETSTESGDKVVSLDSFRKKP